MVDQSFFNSLCLLAIAVAVWIGVFAGWPAI